MSDGRTPDPSEYQRLGFCNNPFPPIDESATSPLWTRVLTHAATNRLMSAVMRASSGSRPVKITSPEEMPDYYHRVALNAFLGASGRDEALSMLALNVPLEIMKLGTIRGVIAEFAERVAAMDLPLTVGLYLRDRLSDPDLTLPEAAALVDGQLDEARDAFLADPAAAMYRFLGRRTTDAVPSREEQFDALHMTYLRGVGLDPSPIEDEIGDGIADELDSDVGVDAVADTTPAEVVSPDDAMRDYLLAIIHTDLSPVVARALAGYREFGEAMVAQELKITKAPRKTMRAILRLLSYRWDHIVLLWETFDAWPLMEQQTKLDVMAALNELRWMIGEYGVMGVNMVPGLAPEIEEMFAGAEQVDWSLPGFTELYAGDMSWNQELVQSWIDSASVLQPSAVRVDGALLAPMVAAAESDVMRFALMAEAAFRDAVLRCAVELDEAAVRAGIDSVRIGDDA